MFRSAANVNIYFLNDYFNAISFNGVSSYLILTIKYYRSIFIFFPMCTFLLEFMTRATGSRTGPAKEDSPSEGWHVERGDNDWTGRRAG